MSKRLSVPTRRPSSIDDLSALPTRSGSMTALGSSAVSPESFRTPTYDKPEFCRPPLPHRNSSMSSFSTVSSHRGSTDSGLFSHEEFPAGEGRMRELNIEDYSPGPSDEQQLHLQQIARAGMKRRASSPQREATRDDRSSVSSIAPHNDLFHRRSLQHFPSHANTISRYPHHYGSVSSQSSYSNRTNSMASSYRVSISSSVTSYASGRLSPSLPSPAAFEPESTPGGLFPFPISKSSATSPRASVANPSYQRADAEISPIGIKKPPEDDVFPFPRNASISLSIPTMTDMFICDCCPKKPKKFHTEEDLR